MIKSFSAQPPCTLVIHYKNGNQRTLDLTVWIKENSALKNPVLFLGVYLNSGGAEWACGAYLDPIHIERMLAKQAIAMVVR